MGRRSRAAEEVEAHGENFAVASKLKLGLILTELKFGLYTDRSDIFGLL